MKLFEGCAQKTEQYLIAEDLIGKDLQVLSCPTQWLQIVMVALSISNT